MLDGDEGTLGAALRHLARQARAATVEAARAEYHALFIGVARGELVPYASFYLTGFLHERPLARLRADMARLGFALVPGRSDPEDHIASILDVMASLIEEQHAEEAAFFERHLANWAGRFFADLERTQTARLYRPIGELGRVLIELDRQGFALADSASPQRGAA
ncbi:MAG TPA: molecular chaperone TorD family protein [Acetobacteraceae bacterium]|nr:molecular chaperone TorD family protein [Acetobacteraceae bacterium]